MPPLQVVEPLISNQEGEKKFHSSKLINLVSFFLNPVIVIFLLRDNLIMLGKEKSARNITIVAFILLLVESLSPIDTGGHLVILCNIFFSVYVQTKLFTEDEKKLIESTGERPPLFKHLTYGLVCTFLVVYLTGFL